MVGKSEVVDRTSRLIVLVEEKRENNGHGK